MRGTVQIIGDGVYAINDRLEISGEGSTVFTFARGWLLEVIELGSGDYYFISDGVAVWPDADRFAVFYPAFSMTRVCVRNVKGRVRGIGSVNSFPDLPKGPMMFLTNFAGEFAEVADAFRVISDGTDRRSIEVNAHPSLLTIKAKRLIDENYLVFPSISRIAERLKVSAAHLSRTFKRDLGVTPSGYLHQLRVADATFRLSTGEEIIDISHEVGYNDLSRFYKQFRKSTRTSPGACRDVLAASK